MPELTAVIEQHDVVIEIGSIPVRIRTADPAFMAMLQDRYAGFLGHSGHAEYEFDIDLAPPDRPELTRMCACSSETADGRSTVGISTRSGIRL